MGSKWFAILSCVLQFYPSLIPFTYAPGPRNHPFPLYPSKDALCLPGERIGKSGPFLRLANCRWSLCVTGNQICPFCYTVKDSDSKNYICGFLDTCPLSPPVTPETVAYVSHSAVYILESICLSLLRCIWLELGWMVDLNQLSMENSHTF